MLRVLYPAGKLGTSRELERELRNFAKTTKQRWKVVLGRSSELGTLRFRTIDSIVLLARLGSSAKPAPSTTLNSFYKPWIRFSKSSLTAWKSRSLNF
jgi:hypothetical protein